MESRSTDPNLIRSVHQGNVFTQNKWTSGGGGKGGGPDFRDFCVSKDEF